MRSAEKERVELMRRGKCSFKRLVLTRVRRIFRSEPGLCILVLVGIAEMFSYSNKLKSLLSLPGPCATLLEPSTPAPKPRRHDERSTFTIMKSRGKPFDEDTRETRRDGGLVLDALSIGTQYNINLLRAQQKTWATATSIRFYFAATEKDDADPSCHKILKKDTITEIVNWCRKNESRKVKSGMKIQYQRFALGGFKRKGAGWMCAQQRFAIALEKLGLFYRRELEVDENALPDFLMVEDDDTWYNMVKIQQFLQSKDPEIPLVEASCLIRHTETRNFSFPWGGYGSFFSKGAVANLIRPIYCNSTVATMDQFERNVCSRLEDDIIGERKFFENGMSVSDLMGAHVRRSIFADFNKTGSSYCLHGDWAIGYYINFYYLANHIKDPRYANTPEVRIEASLGGTFKEDRGNCVYTNLEYCTEAAHSCHRQNAKSMHNHTKILSLKHPDVFRIN